MTNGGGIRLMIRPDCTSCVPWDAYWSGENRSIALLGRAAQAPCLPKSLEHSLRRMRWLYVTTRIHSVMVDTAGRCCQEKIPHCARWLLDCLGPVVREAREVGRQNKHQKSMGGSFALHNGWAILVVLIIDLCSHRSETLCPRSGTQGILCKASPSVLPRPSDWAFPVLV